MLDHVEQILRAKSLIEQAHRLRAEGLSLTQRGSTHKTICPFRRRYDCHTSLVNCKEVWLPNVIQADYSGILNKVSASSLRGQVANAIGMDRVIVERIDKAMMLFDEPIPMLQAGVDVPMGCFIVRPDQLDAVFAFSRQLAATGVVRSVFLTGVEERVAQNWVMEVAA